MRIFGVDPGQTGAAVEIAADGRTVLGQQRWSKCRVPPLVELPAGALVVLEAQHVGRHQASLRLAEWCGALLQQWGAPVSEIRDPVSQSVIGWRLSTGTVLLRPLATTWRARVFRRGRMSREVAKATAIAAAEAFVGDRQPDACEAWAMARYGWGWVTAHPEVLL